MTLIVDLACQLHFKVKEVELTLVLNRMYVFLF